MPCLGHLRAARTYRKIISNKYRDAVSYILWILFAFFLAAPSVGFAIALTTPSDNIIARWMERRDLVLSVKEQSGTDVVTRLLGKSYMWKGIMSFGVPISVCLLETKVLEPLSAHYGRFTGVSPAWLMATGFTMNLWIVPGFVLVILHENCLGHWRDLWTECNIERSNLIFCDFKGEEFLGKDDFCATPSLLGLVQKGSCMRSIVQILAPFITRKFIFRHLLRQAWRVLLWSFSRRHENGQRRLWNCFLLDDPITAQRQLAFINQWSVTAVLWGPLIPLLNLVLLLVLVSEFLVYKLRAEHFYFADEISHAMIPSYGIMAAALALALVILFFLSLEIDLPLTFVFLCYLPLLILHRCMVRFVPGSSAESTDMGTEIELVDVGHGTLGDFSPDKIDTFSASFITDSKGVPDDLSSFSLAIDRRSEHTAAQKDETLQTGATQEGDSVARRDGARSDPRSKCGSARSRRPEAFVWTASLDESDADSIMRHVDSRQRSDSFDLANGPPQAAWTQNENAKTSATTRSEASRYTWTDPIDEK